VQNGSPQFPPVGTCVWDGTIWTQAADVGPPQRGSAALGYDATRERIVHFGGANIGGIFERDSWEWDGNAWEQVANMSPTPSTESCDDGYERGDTSLRRPGAYRREHAYGAVRRHVDVGWPILASAAGHGPEPPVLVSNGLGRCEGAWSTFGGVTLVAGEDMFLNDPGNHSRPRNSERSLMRGPGSGPRGNRSPGDPCRPLRRPTRSTTSRGVPRGRGLGDAVKTTISDQAGYKRLAAPGKPLFKRAE
jgi:hypothetical protein